MQNPPCPEERPSCDRAEMNSRSHETRSAILQPYLHALPKRTLARIAERAIGLGPVISCEIDAQRSLPVEEGFSGEKLDQVFHARLADGSTQSVRIFMIRVEGKGRAPTGGRGPGR